MKARRRAILSNATIVSAAVIVVCAGLMTGDYLIARSRTLRDEKVVSGLQEKVKSDASLASALEAEQKRITGQRDARKGRVRFLSYLLIAASAMFLNGAKQMLACRPAIPKQLPRLAAHPPPAPAKQASPAKAPRTFPATLDLTIIDQIVAREGRGAESAIPLLQAIQAHYRYLPDEALQRVCELTGIPPRQIAGTSSFYSQFRRSPVGRHIVRVCHGTACHVSGARQISEELRRSLEIPPSADTDPGGMFTVEEVACLGCCSLAPVLMVDERTVGRLTPLTARDALDAVEPREPA